MKGKAHDPTIQGFAKQYPGCTLYTRKKSGGTTVVGTSKSGRGILLRTLVLVFLATFLYLQLHVTFSLTGRDDSGQSSSNETLFSLVPQELHRFLKEGRNSSTGLTNVSSGALTEFEIAEIRRKIERANAEQKVYNEEAFGPLASDAPIIVIQVHTRLTYLRHLIVSLAQAKDIEQALLVFSHDIWHPDINYLVQSVDFCRVMQIFYPHSIQTHPHTFPGEGPNDCPRNIRKEQALNLKCANAKHPDLYGHYREAKFTQTKHHWWWKANRVFDRLSVTRNHTGMVLFLEEDHYVAEDFLHVLRLMERTCKLSCERCNVLSLGTYLKTYNYFTDLTRKFLGVDSALQKELLRGLKRQEAPATRRQIGGNGVVDDVTVGGATGIANGSTAGGTTGGIAAYGGGRSGGITGNVISGGGGGGGGGSSSSVSTYQNVANAMQTAPAWAFQLLPSLYNHYQKVLRDRNHPRPRLEQTACRHTLILWLAWPSCTFLFASSPLFRRVSCYLLCENERVQTSHPAPVNFIPARLRHFARLPTGSRRSTPTNDAPIDHTSNCLTLNWRIMRALSWCLVCVESVESRELRIHGDPCGHSACFD